MAIDDRGFPWRPVGTSHATYCWRGGFGQCGCCVLWSYLELKSEVRFGENEMMPSGSRPPAPAIGLFVLLLLRQKLFDLFLLAERLRYVVL